MIHLDRTVSLFRTETRPRYTRSFVRLVRMRDVFLLFEGLLRSKNRKCVTLQMIGEFLADARLYMGTLKLPDA
jgi:hypothetical protein